MLVLSAVAITLAQYSSHPGSNPMLPFNPPVSQQGAVNTQMWHAQDELGRASFGYAYPGQAAANYRDAAGNMIGSWSYINPNGKLVATSYVADHRGFHVQSNDLPVAPVDNWVAPVAPVAPAVVAPTPTIKDVSSEIKPAITTPIKTPEPVTKDPAAVIIADDWQCLQARRKRQTDQVAYMVASKESNENAYPFMVSFWPLKMIEKRIPKSNCLTLRMHVSGIMPSQFKNRLPWSRTMQILQCRRTLAEHL
jgi:hypothetical protein